MNRNRFLGMIAVVAIIGLFFAGCHNNDTTIIDPCADGHLWSEWMPAPSCVAVEQTRTCTRAGCTVAPETRTAAGLGHDLPVGWTVHTPATCVAEGEERRTCQRDNCNYFEQQVIPALNPIIGHTPNNIWVRTGFYPQQETSRFCSVCSETLETFTGGSRVRTSAVLGNMMWIPAGTFTMGSPSGEMGRISTGELAETQRQVTLSSGFYMGRTQVTRAQWFSVMGTSPWGAGAADNTALTHVSWYDAIVFANRLSIQSGLTVAYHVSGVTDWLTVTAPTSEDAAWNDATVVAGSTGYRLPTEAQWEYAARAGTVTAFNDGVTNVWNDTVAVRLLAWFSGAPGGTHVREVGLLRPNAWGLYDMHGNVWELVWDWFGAYPSEAQTDPTGASSGTSRVMRGGSWSFSALDLRSARRGGSWPDYRWGSTGFRLLRP